VRKAIGKICRRVWGGGGFPERWKEGIIVPIAKKRGAESVEEHRGVTLMPTAYKIYAMVLAERLKREMEEKGMLPERQAGFRKGRGVIDNIYTLNYVVERELARGNRIVATFVDLRTAFDSVDRWVLGRSLEERGVSARLRRRIMEIYEDTRSVVRIGGRVGKRFWTGKGVRQGCPLSPLLFNLLVVDIEKELGKDGVGGETGG